MRVGLGQLRVGEDRGANLDALASAVAHFAEAGVDLAVFPEAAMVQFPRPGQSAWAIAEPNDGAYVTSLRRLSTEHGVTIVAGYFERDDSGRAFNTLAVVEPERGVVAEYRKIHLFDALGQRESDTFIPGEPAPAVVPLHGMRIGLQTCYDLRFPELSRALVGAGAEVLVVPSAWYDGPSKVDHWNVLLRARAIENTAYVVACGQAGDPFIGRSQVIDPYGLPLLEAGAEPGEFIVDVSADRVTEVRHQLPSLAHRQLPQR